MNALRLIAQTIKLNHQDLGIPKVSADATTLNAFLSIAFEGIGAIAVLIIILAAFSYITSEGSATKAKAARMTIIYAAIGLAVTVSAFVIVQFVIGKALP